MAPELVNLDDLVPSTGNGGSLLTGTGAPSGACTTGDNDIDLTTGEVYHCSSAKWADTSKSLKGLVTYDCSAAPYPGVDLAGCDLSNAKLDGTTLVGAPTSPVPTWRRPPSSTPSWAAPT
ncbi:MAG TPA: hypothetical protein VED59_07495 [Acidimicrobiales bacterium]|nr:hypothetical protein [Acidimicrobiales bacterium]